MAAEEEMDTTSGREKEYHDAAVREASAKPAPFLMPLGHNDANATENGTAPTADKMFEEPAKSAETLGRLCSCTGCDKRVKDHWEDFIENTTIHGPREVRHSDYLLERLFFLVVVLISVGLTGMNMVTMFKEYFSFNTTSNTVAVSPSDPEIFQYLEIVYCATDWLDRQKGQNAGLSPDLMGYLEEVLKVNTGAGLIELVEARNISFEDNATVQHYQAMRTGLRLFLERNRRRFPTLRVLLETIAVDFSTSMNKTLLCPEEEGNLCPYEFVPQTSKGYTVRSGRLCQHLAPHLDEKAEADPLSSGTQVMFALRHMHDYNYKGNIKVAIRSYLGEIVTTGLSQATGLSFEDIIVFDAKQEFCDVSITVAMYKILRKSTVYNRCKGTNEYMQGVRQPQNFPPDICRLICVDYAYYTKTHFNCSLFFPLYNITMMKSYDYDGEYDTWDPCSPYNMYEANRTNLREVKGAYQRCTQNMECSQVKPCEEWSGTLSPMRDAHTNKVAICREEHKTNTTDVRLQLVPSRILVITESLAVSFTQMYSNIGGVMGLALGASITSILDFLSHLIKGLLMHVKCRTTKVSQ